MFLPSGRVVTDREGRRFSVATTPRHSLAAYNSVSRRNTVGAVDTTPAVAEPPSTHQNYRNQIGSESATEDNFQPYSPGRKGSMSKVVRSVKNVTKGYSSVQVKVRNGMYCFSIFYHC